MSAAEAHSSTVDEGAPTCHWPLCVYVHIVHGLDVKTHQQCLKLFAQMLLASS